MPLQTAVAAAEVALTSLEANEKKAKSLLEALRGEQEDLREQQRLLRQSSPSGLLSHTASSFAFALSPNPTETPLADEDSEAAIASHASSKESPQSAVRLTETLAAVEEGEERLSREAGVLSETETFCGLPARKDTQTGLSVTCASISAVQIATAPCSEAIPLNGKLHPEAKNGRLGKALRFASRTQFLL